MRPAYPPLEENSMSGDSRFTVRDIAKRLDVPIHRVKYAMQLYDIEARERVGIIRLFSEADIPAIQNAIRRVAERRGGGR